MDGPPPQWKNDRWENMRLPDFIKKYKQQAQEKVQLSDLKKKKGLKITWKEYESGITDNDLYALQSLRLKTNNTPNNPRISPKGTFTPQGSALSRRDISPLSTCKEIR